MKRLILAVAGCLLLAAPAQADTIVKRIRTSKAQVVAEIKTSRAVGSHREGIKGNGVTRWKCQGFNKSRSGKARTWRCTIHTGECSAYWRLGKVRRVTSRGAQYVVWDHDQLQHLTCPR